MGAFHCSSLAQQIDWGMRVVGIGTVFANESE